MAITRYDCITCKVRSCSVLNNCDTSTLTAISTYKLSRWLQKGERLFSEGDPVLGVYFENRAEWKAGQTVDPPDRR